MNRVFILWMLLAAVFLVTQGNTKITRKGHYFDASYVEYIEKWRSKEKDIRRLFGNPMEKDRKSRFDEVWTYMYYETEHVISDDTGKGKEESRPGAAKSLEITFRKGVVADFSLVEFNTPISDFQKPMEFSSFSLKPPQSPEWKILMKTKKGVSFVRKTGNAKRNITAFVAPEAKQEEGIKTPDDLEKAARNKLEKLIKSPEIKNVKLERRPISIDKQDGIELRGTMRGIKDRDKGSDPFSVRIYHVCVVHPNPKKNEIIHIGYAQRFPAGHKRIDIKGEIKSLFESFKFKDRED